MTHVSPFALVYSPELAAHLAAIPAKFHSLIREKIEEQLLHEPLVETRNRKPLRQPATPAAAWEIRFGANNRFRVFYDVDAAGRTVQILAIGVKDRDRLFVAGEEIEA